MIDDKRDNTSAQYLSIQTFLDGKTITLTNVYNPHDREVLPKNPACMVHSDTVLLCENIIGRHPLLTLREAP